MKVICLSTLDKFSRFYLDIERELKAKSKTDISLKVFSLYLSGFLYTLIRLKYSSWISVKAWVLAQRKKKLYSEIINSQNTYKSIKFNDYYVFHKALSKKTSIKYLQLQTLAYIDIFDAIFSKEQPDYLISIGDSRLCIEIAIALAKSKEIKVFYIEQGPFNTTFFDNEGVNANISIRTKENLVNHTNTDVATKSERSTKKYNRSPIYRGLDIVLMSLFENTFIYPPDLKYSDLNSYRSKRSYSKLDHIKKEQRALLILQVPLDVNMIYHSPNYKSHTEIIESVYTNLPKSLKLVVREHPLYVNKYEAPLYEFISKNNILIDNSTPLNAALDLAKIVIVNNSTVGIEAIFNNKTVVVLGNAFYDNKDICLKLEEKKELSNILEKAIDYIPNKSKIDTFKNELHSTVLLKGAITDKSLVSSKTIANHLLAYE
jgi:capsular polysaccharide export protein